MQVTIFRAVHVFIRPLVSIVLDVDECTMLDSNGYRIHDCHDNAECVNLPGNFTCQCNDGFQGNGRSCQGINSLQLHRHFTCLEL